MEILNPANVPSQFGLKTLEKTLKTKENHISLVLGVPKERSNDEKRVCLTPGGVSVLTANGHRVLFEKDAGIDAKFNNIDYAEAGAEIVESADEVFKNSEILVKVAPPTESELTRMHQGQVLLSAVHLGNVSEGFLKSLIQKNITALGFEFLQSEDGTYPIVRMMHEITGSIAVQVAGHYLENSQKGPGIIMGGISGIPPATVVILGAGIIAEYAARTALGFGAQVFVMDNDLSALRRLENALDRRIITAIANHQYLSAALKSADVVIGAALTEGGKAQCWVTKGIVETMKPGSVIVDAVIDQGGCVETSEVTTQTNPVFLKNGVLHYCVPNIPSNVARTATSALNNVIVPYLLHIGDAGGLHHAVWTNHDIRQGVYVHKRNLTKKSLSKLFDLPYREIDMLIAAQHDTQRN